MKQKLNTLPMHLILHPVFSKVLVAQSLVLCVVFSKKSLKIPKGQSESVYRKRTDNTMAKRK